MSKTYRVFFSVDKEMYEYLQSRANTELRKLGEMARFLMVKGLEADDPKRAKAESE